MLHKSYFMSYMEYRFILCRYRYILSLTFKIWSGAFSKINSDLRMDLNFIWALHNSINQAEFRKGIESLPQTLMF